MNDIFEENKEDLNYLIGLGKELKTQDNLGTRKPLIFKIRDIEVVECIKSLEDFKKIGFYLNYGEEVIFEESQIEQVKEIIKSKNDYIFDFDDNNEAQDHLDICVNLDEIIDFCDTYEIECQIHYFAKEFRYKEEFLTRKAAEEHLKKFHYRYNNEAKIYCCSGVENEELTRLTSILEKIYDNSVKNQD